MKSIFLNRLISFVTLFAAAVSASAPARADGFRLKSNSSRSEGIPAGNFLAFSGIGYLNGQTESGRTFTGGGLRFLGGFEDSTGTGRIELEGVGSKCANCSLEAGLVGRMKGSVLDLERRIYIDLKFVDGSPSRAAFGSGRLGYVFGDRALNIAAYGGPEFAREFAADVLSASLVGGAEVALSVERWLRVRARIEAGPLFASKRDASLPSTSNPLAHELSARSSTPDGVGTLFRTELESEIRPGEKLPFIIVLRGTAANVRFKQKFLPDPSSQDQSSESRQYNNWDLGLTVGAGLAF